ncbi:MAG: hypothetical protein V4641_01835 [Pseudomonadota bacterium]
MNALTTQQDQQFTLTPRNLTEAMEFATIISKSDMVPKHYIGKPGNVMVAVQMGAELGLKPMQALQGIAVINGNPGVWGDAMWALILSHPEYEDSTEDVKDSGSTIMLKRKGQSKRVVTYDLNDAKKAGLLEKPGPWKTATKRMMQLRARAFACRDLFADALKGIKSVEELRDYPPEPERDMGAAEVVQDPAFAALVQEASAAAVRGMTAYNEFWKTTGKENRKLLAEHHETFKQSADQADRDAAPAAEPADQGADPAAAGDVDPFITALDAAE